MVPVGVAFLPLSVFAQNDLTDIFERFGSLLNVIITVLMVLATVVFLWGIVKYLTAGGDEEKIKEARSMIIWGIIFLAVMVAVWAFVNIVLDFVFGNAAIPGVPIGPQQ
ncbi:MAG: hypothetical protein G01um101429_607 [Parcubacteria group bacterium Gr01-1014_29]|nr:MAG: hypothetical protein G01um101429_607 [Parcubacteria group bacterium Gr01-1014_29]